MGAEPAASHADAPRSSRAEHTRERILDAAEAVFAERGFDAATTREIAALSGTNVATPYSYFEGKEALYAAVIERAIQPLIALMEAFGQQADKPGAAPATIQSVMERLASHGGTTRLIYREVVSNGPLSDRLRTTLFAPLIQRVCEELEGNAPVDAEMVPFLASLYVHLSFSHVALAPLLSKVFDRDMLSADSLAKQVQVIAAAGALGVRGFSEPD